MAAKRNLIYLLRRSRGLSQEQLARLAGITQPVVSRIETGDRKPSLDTALRLAAVFGLTVEELFGGEADERRAASGC